MHIRLNATLTTPVLNTGCGFLSFYHIPQVEIINPRDNQQPLRQFLFEITKSGLIIMKNMLVACGFKINNDMGLIIRQAYLERRGMTNENLQCLRQAVT
jgi:hypothetical protein